MLLFGMMAEHAGADRLVVEATNMHELRQALAQHIPHLDQLQFTIAVDQIVQHGNIPLTGSEEIAVLPPYAGG